MPYAQQLGRYQLLDRIAFGGMAEIFRAKTFDAEGQVHLVAVKKVLSHLVHDEDFLRMLVDEAKITATLKHDNIARVYEFSHTDGEYFMAMEYVDGKDVRSILERHRQQKTPLPPEHVAWIAMQVAHALFAAHTQKDGAGRPLNIVHRDVSPSNVLCSYRGEIKLCDFGIAKATLTRVQTKTGVIKGKVKYMSPEQAMGRKLDHRSDLFSLGTVMYEMLTLQAPFIAQSEVEMIFAVRDARKKDARDLNPDIPPELNTILNKVMSRSRSQRYQSAQDLALALRLFLDRYRSDYRRSHFGRYMRKSFEGEIERELRLLEQYVIQHADPTKVGINLIAEVLGDDAPYTQFTAAVLGSRAGSNVQTSYFPRVESHVPTDLHAEPTRILTRNQTGGPGDLHGLETKLFDPSSRLRAEGDPSPTDPSAKGDLHALQTKLFNLPEGAPPKELHALKTQILGQQADRSPHPPLSAADSQVPTRLHPQSARGEIQSSSNAIDTQAGTQILSDSGAPQPVSRSVAIDPSLVLEAPVPGQPLQSKTAPLRPGILNPVDSVATPKIGELSKRSARPSQAAVPKAEPSSTDLPPQKTAISPPPSGPRKSLHSLVGVDPGLAEEPEPLPAPPEADPSYPEGGNRDPLASLALDGPAPQSRRPRDFADGEREDTPLVDREGVDDSGEVSRLDSGDLEEVDDDESV